MSRYYAVERATLRIDAAELLGAIWYVDGSGACVGVGIEGPSSDWIIEAVRLVDEGRYVEIDVRAALGEDS